MPIWGAGSNRSNNNTAEGGKAEVHIHVSAPKPKPLRSQTKRPGAASAEESAGSNLRTTRWS